MARVNAERISQGLTPVSMNTGAYCRARNRLSEELLHSLEKDSGANLESEALKDWLWKSRRVKLIDGSTVSMPDTVANQAEYPQQAAQKKGLGFPIARLVAVLSLNTGAVLDLSLGAYQGKLTGEHALLRNLFGSFEAGDVALADAYYCLYFLIAILQAIGVDMVCRLHGARRSDFRQGERLNKGDHIVIYERPERPDWMSKKMYEVECGRLIGSHVPKG